MLGDCNTTCSPSSTRGDSDTKSGTILNYIFVIISMQVFKAPVRPELEDRVVFSIARL